MISCLQRALRDTTSLVAPSALSRTTALATGVIAGTLLFPSGQALAQQVWNGTGSDFNTGANWTSGTVPGVGNVAVFAGTTANNNLGTSQNTSLGGITYNVGASPYAITLGDNLQLFGNVTNNSSATQVIDVGGKAIFFYAAANSGTNVTYNLAAGGEIQFRDNSVGGLSRFTLGALSRIGIFDAAKVVALGSLSGSGLIENVAPGATLTIGGLNETSTFSGQISSGGGGGLLGIEKVGSGTLILTGTNTYTGGTTISAGALQIGAGGTSGSIAGNVLNNAALVFDRSDSVTFGGVISGSGTLTKMGAGTLTLSSSNTYSGGTSLTDGTLAVASGTSLGSGPLQMSGATTFRALGNLTVNNAVSLAGGTATIDTDSFDLGLGGVISGIGTLTKTGTGTLTLSGVNTYSGATWIQDGTLQMGGSGALSNQTSVQISAGATFDLNGLTQSVGSLSGTGDVLLSGATLRAGNNNTDTTFSGAISGAGALLKDGTGTLTLNGANLHTGVTQVLGGRLVVDGSVASPVIVMPGATLAGSGSVGATTVGGTLSPGNSPGTLTINGNLVMGGASTYVAEVQGAVADRVNVTGTASLAGTLRLVPLGGAYTFNSAYTLLSATGGLGGTRFSPVATAGPFGDGVTTSIAYTATDVLLTLTPKPLVPIVDPAVPAPAPAGPRLGVGRPANAYAVAAAIDGAVANGGDPSALFGIYNLPAAAIPAAVNSLSGEVHTAAPAMANTAADRFLGTLLDGAGAGRLSGAAGGPGGTAGFTADLPSKQDGPGRSTFDPARFSLWGATFGSTGRSDGDRIVGSANRNLSDGHAAVGADIRLGSNTVVGAAVAGGQSRASLSGGLGKAEADIFQAGIYGRTTLGSVNLAAALGYARLETDTTRAISALGLTGVTASYATQAWSGRIEASLPVIAWSGITLSPLAAFQAVRASSPAAVERDVMGATAGMLTLAKRTDMTSRSELGLRLDASLLAGVMPVTGFVRAAWAHYYHRDADLTASLNGLPGALFGVTGARPDRNAALLAAGADVKLSQSVSLGMRVDSELSANTRRLGGTAQLRVSF